MTDAEPKRTPLHALHLALGARMTDFAGYALPVQYPAGTRAEHLHVRERAGLFDVSHMGQIAISGAGAARELEALTPADIQGLAPGRMRYALLTDGAGGVLDDIIATNAGEDGLVVVANAARKDHDAALLRDGLPTCDAELLEDLALLALQGPAAAAALEPLAPGASALPFMGSGLFEVAGAPCRVSRCGYTGEDGFEVSAPADRATEIAEALLAHPAVAPAGLGARDTLRLEAGLCLYGHDLSPGTTPVEAALEWTIARRRRAEGGFPGAETILRQLAEGAPRRRIGVQPLGRAPAREGAEIVDDDGARLGALTSGGFGPSLKAPVAMGYVESRAARENAPLNVVVRGKPLPALAARLPFHPHNHKRGRPGPRGR